MGGRSGQSISGDYSGLTIKEITFGYTKLTDSEQLKYIKLAGVPKDYIGEVEIERFDNDNIKLSITEPDKLIMFRRFNIQEKTVYNVKFSINPNGKYKGQGVNIIKNSVDALIKDGYYKKN